MSKFTVIDLFAGAGGLSLGFEYAGFKTIYALESNEVYSETYKANHPDVDVNVMDIKDISNEEICNTFQDKKINVIIGGPPCQGFSLAGKIGRKFLEDERNRLFLEYLRFVKVLKPDLFVIENVASLERHNRGKTIKEIIEKIEELGYESTYSVLNASDYGVPQDRRRIFIIGYSNKINGFQFPDTIENKMTIKEAINDLPKLSSGEKSEIYLHNAMNHTEQMLKKMSYVKDGGTRLDIPEELRPKSGDIRKYIRYDSGKPSMCITGDMRKVFHYEQNRALTCRELARIQTFPDDYIFCGNSIGIQQQIGNAVPPKLAKLIAECVKRSLEDAEISDN
ncbi:DNA cytosine methyltransferase [Faecalimonas sp.]